LDIEYTEETAYIQTTVFTRFSNLVNFKLFK